MGEENLISHSLFHFFQKKLANHVTSGGVTFEVSSRKIFYCTCVAHYQRNFLELRRCSCIVDMRHNCIFCGLLRHRYKIIIHLPSLFSFICCFAPPLSLKLIFSRVYLGIIVDASPLWPLTEAIFGDFAVSHLCFEDFFLFQMFVIARHGLAKIVFIEHHGNIKTYETPKGE